MTYQKTILITGGTTGLGYETALAIARAEPTSLVVISSRSDKAKAADTINKTLGQQNTIFLSLDLGSQANVRAYAQAWAKARYPPIQALLLNAALQFPGPLVKTADGIEATFGISHVGNTLLFHLLCPYLAQNARVVLTASGTHDPAQMEGLPSAVTVPNAVYNSAEELAHPTGGNITLEGRQRYSTTKLCNVLWTYALDRRLKEHAAERGITVTAFDPGLMPGTGLARDANAPLRFVWKQVMPRMIPLMRHIASPNIHTPRESGESLARLAIGTDVAGVTAEYFEGRKAIKTSTDSYDKSKQEDLWCWTVNYLAETDDEREKFEKLK